MNVWLMTFPADTIATLVAGVELGRSGLAASQSPSRYCWPTLVAIVWLIDPAAVLLRSTLRTPS